MFLQKMSGLFKRYIQYKVCEKNPLCKSEDEEPEQREFIDDGNGKILDTDDNLSSYSELSDDKKRTLKARSECILEQIVDIISKNITKRETNTTDSNAVNEIYNYHITLPYVAYYYSEAEIPNVEYLMVDQYVTNKTYQENEKVIEETQKLLNEHKIKPNEVLIETNDSNGIGNNILTINETDKDIIMLVIEKIFENDNANSINKNGKMITFKKKDDNSIHITIGDNKTYTIKSDYVKEYSRLLTIIQERENKNNQIIDLKQRNKNHARRKEIKREEIKKEIANIIKDGQINDKPSKLKLNNAPEYAPTMDVEKRIIAFDNLITSGAQISNECNASQPLLRYCELVF